MKKSKGFTLIELMIVVSIIGILALIAIPNFQNLRKKAYDASALSAGRSAKLAAEIYYQDHQSDGFGYSSSLADLLVHDRNLTDDESVTFIWSYAGDTNFTFTTSHSRGTSSSDSGGPKTFVFHD
jgi:type IV pilus assembly protein PilA